MAALDQYLKENFQQGIIDFALRATVDAEGECSFYIHPAYVPGTTLDFVVVGNNLACTTLPSTQADAEPQTEPAPGGWDKV